MVSIPGLVSLDSYLEERNRLFLSLWAGTKQGKSYLTLTFPKPIYLFSFEPEGPYWALRDARAEGIISNGDVFLIEVIREGLKKFKSPHAVRTLAEDEAIYSTFKDIFSKVIAQAPEGATVAIDTGSSLWQIIQRVELEPIVERRVKRARVKDPNANEEDIDLFPFDFGKPNSALKSMIDDARNKNTVNLIFTHHDKEVWDNKGQLWDTDFKGKPVPKTAYQGNKHLENWVDVFGKLWYVKDFYDANPNNVDSDGNVIPKNKQIELGMCSRRWFQIEKCRIDPLAEGKEINNPSYEKIMRVLEKEDTQVPETSDLSSYSSSLSDSPEFITSLDYST